MLLARGPRYRVLLPNELIGSDPELAAAAPWLGGLVPKTGASFWLEILE